MRIKPYAKFIVEYDSGNGTSYFYKIMKYDIIVKEWKILDGIFFTLDSVQKEIELLNQEAGRIEIEL